MTTQETEVIDAPSTELTRAVQDARLPEKAAANLLETFQPYFNEAYPIARKARDLVVTAADQLTEMKAAREARLELRRIRVEAEKARKQTKEEALRTERAIDKVAGVVKTMCEEAEDYLMEQETFAERAEAARKARVKAEREAKIRPWTPQGVTPDAYNLAEMSDVAFDGLLDSLRRAHEDRIREAEEARRKAEEERAAREAEERRVREENERLRRERAEAEEAARAELEKRRAEFEAELAKQQEAHRRDCERREDQARKEREAREAAERELRERQDAEEKARKAKAAAERKAARAPDAEKLRRYVGELNAVPMPQMKTEDGRAALERVKRAMKAALQEALEVAKDLD